MFQRMATGDTYELRNTVSVQKTVIRNANSLQAGIQAVVTEWRIGVWYNVATRNAPSKNIITIILVRPAAALQRRGVELEVNAHCILICSTFCGFFFNQSITSRVLL